MKESKTTPVIQSVAPAKNTGGLALTPPVGAPPIIQTKLLVGHPNDPLEHEADRAADRVVSLWQDGGFSSAPAGEGPPAKPITPIIQRRAASPASGSVEASAQVTQQIQSARGAGQPLPGALQPSLEAAFGMDFSGVRLHTDHRADALNRDLQARAFTTGQDIFFRQGEYRPGTAEGVRLLGHELGHVGQQGGRGMIIQRRRGGVAPESPNLTLSGHFNLTGRYEASGSGLSGLQTLEINHAGNRLRIWAQYYSGTAEGRTSIRIHQSIGWGLIEEDTENEIRCAFNLFNARGGETYSGILTFTRRRGNVNLELHSETPPLVRRFSRVSTEPSLSNLMLEGVDPFIRLQHRSPLTSRQIRNIQRLSERIKHFIRSFLTDDSLGSIRLTRVSAIDQICMNVLASISSEQTHLARQILIHHLVNARYTHNHTTQTYIDWLKVVVAGDSEEDRMVSISHITELTGISRNEGSIEHVYILRIVSIGGEISPVPGLNLGLNRIQVTINKISPDTDRWERDYYGFLVSAGLGLDANIPMPTDRLPVSSLPVSGLPVSGGVSGSSPDTLRTTTNWSANNFVGGIQLMEASGRLSFVGVSVGGARGSVFFSGDGTHRPLYGETGGANWMAGITGISGELGVDYMAGRIWGSRAEVVLPSFRITSRSFPLHSTGRFHFDIDDPSLNGEGYDDVERFCAENQYLFSNPQNRIMVTGYASPSGNPNSTIRRSRNQQLSELRAMNTTQAILNSFQRDIRDTSLSSRITSSGLGDRPALDAGIPDRQESDQWRRVDIAVNGQVVHRLFAAPQPV